MEEINNAMNINAQLPVEMMIFESYSFIIHAVKHKIHYVVKFSIINNNGRVSANWRFSASDRGSDASPQNPSQQKRDRHLIQNPRNILSCLHHSLLRYVP
jgi:hypothetical protein